MAALTEIYGTVPTECYVDEKGVYKDGQKVSLDNARNTGYIRWNGDLTPEKTGNARYAWVKPLVFVGCVPNADPDLLARATISALSGGGTQIIRWTFDKKVIAEEENISMEELTKFHGVAMIWVEYEQQGVGLFDIPTPRTITKPVPVLGIFDNTFDTTFN